MAVCQYLCLNLPYTALCHVLKGYKFPSDSCGGACLTVGCWSFVVMLIFFSSCSWTRRADEIVLLPISNGVLVKTCSPCQESVGSAGAEHT